MLGTLGWIAVGFLIDFLFVRNEAQADGTVKVIQASASNGPLLLAAGLSAALGVYSLFLPHTPPAGKPGDTVPFVRALGLFKDFSFAVFFVVSFVITIVLAFYYTVTSDFLQQAAGVTNTGSTAANTFFSGKGDVLITYESEAYSAFAAGKKGQLVVPKPTASRTCPNTASCRSKNHVPPPTSASPAMMPIPTRPSGPIQPRVKASPRKKIAPRTIASPVQTHRRCGSAATRSAGSARPLTWSGRPPSGPRWRKPGCGRASTTCSAAWPGAASRCCTAS